MRALFVNVCALFSRGVMPLNVIWRGYCEKDGLPTTIKDISGNPKKVKVALNNYLLAHSFYNLDEYFGERNTYVMLHTITLYKFNLYCAYYIHRYLLYNFISILYFIIITAFRLI